MGVEIGVRVTREETAGFGETIKVLGEEREIGRRQESCHYMFVCGE